MSEQEEPVSAEHDSTRREALRRFWAAGLVATVSAGLTELLLSPRVFAATAPAATQMPVSSVLSVLPAGAPPGLREAIASGCCFTYTRDEGACSPACPAGQCCYHVTGCGYDYTMCIGVSCSRGNFTSGC